MLLIDGPHPTSMTIGSSTSGSKLGTVKKLLLTSKIPFFKNPKMAKDP